MTEEMVVYEGGHQLAPANLFGADGPQAIVEKATAVANALAPVIEKMKLFTVISNRKHVRVEGWTLLGTMLGVFPVLVWSRPIEGGWEARVEARTLMGAVVGAAEAECVRSESTWSQREDFALRSMSQTRATSKALRIPLGFIMTLGGYEATPAEEMTFGQAPPMDAPPASGGPPQPQERSKPASADSMTDSQRKAIFAISRNLDVDAEEMALDRYGSTVGQLTKRQASELIDLLKTG